MVDVNIMRKDLKTCLDTAQDATVILLHQAIVKDQPKQPTKDWWNDLPEHQTAAIDMATNELDNGKGLPDAEVKKQYPQWFVK